MRSDLACTTTYDDCMAASSKRHPMRRARALILCEESKYLSVRFLKEGSSALSLRRVLDDADPRDEVLGLPMVADGCDCF